MTYCIRRRTTHPCVDRSGQWNEPVQNYTRPRKHVQDSTSTVGTRMCWATHAHTHLRRNTLFFGRSSACDVCTATKQMMPALRTSRGSWLGVLARIDADTLLPHFTPTLQQQTHTTRQHEHDERSTNRRKAKIICYFYRRSEGQGFTL